MSVAYGSVVGGLVKKYPCIPHSCYNDGMVDPKTREFIRKTIRSYLPDPGYKVFVFGSRTYDRHHPYSDIDVGVSGDRPVPANTLMRIQERFEESSLPVHVDVVDFTNASKDFVRIAGESTIAL